MAKIDDILIELTDTELAYLNKYRLDGYLISTQAKIRDYIFNTRGLTVNSLESLITQNENKTFENCETRCPRCKTDKVRSDRVNWNIPLFRAGAEDEYASLYEIQTGQLYKKDLVVCNICGYVLVNPNNEKRSFYKKLADFFFDNPIWSIFRKK